jgi:hypothetical protein
LFVSQKRLFQQYRSSTDLTAPKFDFRFSLEADSSRTSGDVRKVPEGDIVLATSSRIKELHPLWAPSQGALEVE